MGKGRYISVVVAVVGAAIVAGLFVFNQHALSYDRYIVVNLLGLMWIPMLTLILVFREEPSNFGFALGSWKRIWIVLVVLGAGLVALMLTISRWPAYQDYYPVFRRFDEFRGLFASYPRVNPYTAAPWLMLYAEASYGMYLFCWEFFFRGYLLFGLQRSIGWWAVLAQAIGFGLLHHGKVPSEFYASFGAGVILGIIALNAKSFLPCFVLHWAASLTFNFLVVAARAR